jgi:hypothetical protein
VARVSVLLAVLPAAFALVAPARAAAPNYILVSGPGLHRPALLGNWAENGDLLSALVYAPHARRNVLRGQPRLDLALFWGWSGRPLPTRPGEANQHGWFYPARRSRPAVVDLLVDGWLVPRIAPARVLRILARHGVPTRY